MTEKTFFSLKSDVQWRQREFKVGRRKRRRGWVWGGGVSLPSGNTPSTLGEESGRGQTFLFCDLKMAYFGEF